MTAPAEGARRRVRSVQIDEQAAGQRIDNFLLRELKGVPRSWVYRTLRKGEVRVNSGRIGPEYRLRPGDTVRIPPLRQGEERVPAAPAAGLLQRLEDAILHEDEDLIVLDKPAGLAVHGGSGLSHGAIEALRAARGPHATLELVHRLDRDTSGCLLVAKKRSALRALHGLLRENGVEKRYLALLCGRWPRGTRMVDAPLRKSVLRGGERLVRAGGEGKAALTEFRWREDFAAATLVEAVLHSGRTHQIRVHAAHAGHPVAGDAKYGDPQCNRALREQGLKRLFLHAHALCFPRPSGTGEIRVTAPLDPDLEGLLSRLRAEAPPPGRAKR